VLIGIDSRYVSFFTDENGHSTDKPAISVILDIPHSLNGFFPNCDSSEINESSAMKKVSYLFWVGLCVTSGFLAGCAAYGNHSAPPGDRSEVSDVGGGSIAPYRPAPPPKSNSSRSVPTAPPSFAGSGTR